MQLDMISLNGSFTIYLGGDSPGDAGTQDPCTLNVMSFCMYTSPSTYHLDGHMKVENLQTRGLLTNYAQASSLDCGSLTVHENLDVTGTLTTSNGIADPYPGVRFTPTLSSFEMDVSAPNLYDRTQVDELVAMLEIEFLRAEVRLQRTLIQNLEDRLAEMENK
jgi:hypothetical protein